MATRIRPNCIGGRDLGIEYPLLEQYRVQKERYFELAEIRRKQRSQRRTGYDRDWGDAIVDQQLSDDPGPINAGTFQPVKRWIVVYRTTPGGLDGTHNITVGDIRDAITGTTATPNPFIIRQLHIWIAPNAVSTHFSGLLLTKDDEDNGILGGQYSDIAPYGEFVKFRVRFRGEGYVVGSAQPRTKEVISIGGSQKWNGVVYAQVETYD